jgi:hypothetical protein
MRSATAAGAGTGAGPLAILAILATRLMLALLAGAHPALADPKPGKQPSGLMVHVPLDGSFVDARALGAVRPEALGTPAFLPGAVAEGALPAIGRFQVGQLHVTRLSRLMLRGRTPAAGTIMIWCRLAAAPGDSTPITVLRSDEPLALEVTVGGDPPALAGSFTDRGGARHRITTPLPVSEAAAAPSWVHVALGWDSAAGAMIAFVGGQPRARTDGSPYEMPGLPKHFELGHPQSAIDDFRLYDRLLAPSELAALPAVGGK